MRCLIQFRTVGKISIFSSVNSLLFSLTLPVFLRVWLTGQTLVHKCGYPPVSPLSRFPVSANMSIVSMLEQSWPFHQRCGAKGTTDIVNMEIRPTHTHAFSPHTRCVCIHAQTPTQTYVSKRVKCWRDRDREGRVKRPCGGSLNLSLCANMAMEVMLMMCRQRTVDYYNC